MVITRIRPLDVKLLFDDRPYSLGEKIDVMVELSARGDVEVREARVDLMWEERYVESYTVMASDLANIKTQARAGGGVYIPPPLIPKRVNKDVRETYVHSSVVFLTDTWLRAGATDRYNARVEIEPESPTHASIATIRWSLVMVVDVARARDIKKRQKVRVTLG